MPWITDCRMSDSKRSGPSSAAIAIARLALAPPAGRVMPDHALSRTSGYCFKKATMFAGWRLSMS